MSYKHKVISSYSDLDESLSMVKRIHFRKFLNQKMLRMVLERCKNLERISLSHYAFKNCDKRVLEDLKRRGIEVIVRKTPGRRSLVERII